MLNFNEFQDEMDRICFEVREKAEEAELHPACTHYLQFKMNGLKNLIHTAKELGQDNIKRLRYSKGDGSVYLTPKSRPNGAIITLYATVD